MKTNLTALLNIIKVNGAVKLQNDKSHHIRKIKGLYIKFYMAHALYLKKASEKLFMEVKTVISNINTLILKYFSLNDSFLFLYTFSKF